MGRRGLPGSSLRSTIQQYIEVDTKERYIFQTGRVSSVKDSARGVLYRIVPSEELAFALLVVESRILQGV